jgi:hypothetical protein
MAQNMSSMVHYSGFIDSPLRLFHTYRACRRQLSPSLIHLVIVTRHIRTIRIIQNSIILFGPQGVEPRPPDRLIWPVNSASAIKHRALSVPSPMPEKMMEAFAVAYAIVLRQRPAMCLVRPSASNGSLLGPAPRTFG